MTLLIAQIQSPDRPNFVDWSRLIDKESRNVLRSRDGLPTLLNKDHLDENILITSLELLPKI